MIKIIFLLPILFLFSNQAFAESNLKAINSYNCFIYDLNEKYVTEANFMYNEGFEGETAADIFEGFSDMSKNIELVKIDDNRKNHIKGFVNECFGGQCNLNLKTSGFDDQIFKLDNPLKNRDEFFVKHAKSDLIFSCMDHSTWIIQREKKVVLDQGKKIISVTGEQLERAGRSVEREYDNTIRRVKRDAPKVIQTITKAAKDVAQGTKIFAKDANELYLPATKVISESVLEVAGEGAKEMTDYIGSELAPTVGQTTKDIGEDIGRGVKGAADHIGEVLAPAIGEAAEDIGKDIADAAQDIGKGAKKVLKDLGINW